MLVLLYLAIAKARWHVASFIKKGYLNTINLNAK